MCVCECEESGSCKMLSVCANKLSVNKPGINRKKIESNEKKENKAKL